MCIGVVCRSPYYFPGENLQYGREYMKADEVVHNSQGNFFVRLTFRLTQTNSVGNCFEQNKGVFTYDVTELWKEIFGEKWLSCAHTRLMNSVYVMK